MTTATASSAKGTWSIDASHSEIGFKVRHLVVTNVSGKFNKFDGSIEAINDNFNDAKISFTADVNSINTGDEARDGHLKSDDFFKAEQFPTISFKSTSVQHVSGNDYKIVGDFTMRDVTKTIELSAEYGGIMVDPWGNTKSGFEVIGKINRSDFNLKWNVMTEVGGAVVSDEIKIHINAELAKQA
ncbi:MAG: YceI family protein [Bacteroidota bacterium]